MHHNETVLNYFSQSNADPAIESESETGLHSTCSLTYKYVLYFMCDAYMGCDQEYPFSVKVHRTPHQPAGGDENIDES